MVLNELNVSYGELKMTETELDAFIKNEKYTSNEESSFPIIVPKISEEYPKSSTKSNIMILPLSIEDESLRTGTACVMREFSQDLDIPLKKSDQYVIYSAQSGKFDLHSARERYRFYQEMEYYDRQMEKFRKLMEEDEIEDTESENNCGNNLPRSDDSGTKPFKTLMKQMSTHMKDVMTKLKDGVNTFANLRDRVSFLKSNSVLWAGLVDDLGCSPLHHAVQDNCVNLVEPLLLAGAGINDPEGCGLTPIMIAINKNNVKLVELLVKYGARVTGVFQGSIPSPVEMARAIGNSDVIKILELQINYEYETWEHVERQLGVREVSNSTNLFRGTTEDIPESPTGKKEEEIRSTFNLTVGDAKSTSTLRGVRNRAPDEFGCFRDVPGDFHTQGYVMECLARISGPGGFYYVMRQLLGRLKITPKSFVDIFKEGNYEPNMDALNSLGSLYSCSCLV